MRGSCRPRTESVLASCSRSHGEIDTGWSRATPQDSAASYHSVKHNTNKHHHSYRSLGCLKLKCRQYPAIHTNYIMSHCTTKYNIIIKYMTQYLGRNEMFNTKNIEFNSVAIFPLWHESSRLGRCQANVPGILRR